MNSSNNLSALSLIDIEKIEEIDDKFADIFTDSELDGKHNFPPIAYQCFNSDYRHKYLLGMARRIDKQV